MARLSESERIDWLQLCRSGGVGPRTFYKLLERFGTARRAYEELPRLMLAAGGERWRRCRRDEAEAELEALQALGAHLIARIEPDYPARLAEIADPPPLLAVLGEPALLAAPAVAIVGARNASAHGRMLAKAPGQGAGRGGAAGGLGPRARHRHGGARGRARRTGRRDGRGDRLRHRRRLSARQRGADGADRRERGGGLRAAARCGAAGAPFSPPQTASSPAFASASSWSRRRRSPAR
jgi:DNA recombination-mediator protein A